MSGHPSVLPIKGGGGDPLVCLALKKNKIFILKSLKVTYCVFRPGLIVTRHLEKRLLWVEDPWTQVFVDLWTEVTPIYS